MDPRDGPGAVDEPTAEQLAALAQQEAELLADTPIGRHRAQQAEVARTHKPTEWEKADAALRAQLDAKNLDEDEHNRLLIEGRHQLSARWGRQLVRRHVRRVATIVRTTSTRDRGRAPRRTVRRVRPTRSPARGEPSRESEPPLAGCALLGGAR
jgi:hypothetical protein